MKKDVIWYGVTALDSRPSWPRWIGPCQVVRPSRRQTSKHVKRDRHAKNDGRHSVDQYVVLDSERDERDGRGNGAR